MMNIILPFAPDQELEPGQHISIPERLQRMTADEFFAFCEANSQLKLERDATGTIEFQSMTGGQTGERNSELNADLTIWNRNARLGRVFDSSTGFQLPNGAVRSPDAAWVANTRWEALTTEQRRKFPPLCPDFLVELRSASDSMAELTVKMQEYIDNGCRLAWLIDPKNETVRVFRANGAVAVIESFDETLSGEDVLPGFRFALSLLR